MEKETSPSLTLSIVSHGDSARVLRLLDSLHAAEPNRCFQILLTDNLGQELPEINSAAGDNLTILRNQKPQGFARNHNEAFRRAETDLFCILNPDIVFTQPVFDRLVFLIESAKADIAAPLLVDSLGTLQDSFRLLPTPLDIVRRKLPGYQFSPLPADADGLIRPDWIAGMFMMLKCETYQAINGFNEKYHLYYEDVDLCIRARSVGLKLLVDPGVQIQHDARRASRDNLMYLLWHVQSAIRFYRSSIYRQAIRTRRD